MLDRDVDPATVGADGVLTPTQLEEVVLDEIGGVLWRNVYLKREGMTEEHVLEFARYGILRLLAASVFFMCSLVCIR